MFVNMAVKVKYQSTTAFTKGPARKGSPAIIALEKNRCGTGNGRNRSRKLTFRRRCWLLRILRAEAER